MAGRPYCNAVVMDSSHGISRFGDGERLHAITSLAPCP